MTPVRSATYLLLRYDPGQSVRLLASRNFSGDFQGFQIYDGDFVGHAYCDVGAGAVGGDQDTCGATSEVQLLHFLVRGGVEHYEARVCGARTQGGDQDSFAVGSELQAVRVLYWDGKCLDRFLSGDVDDGDGCVVRVGSPDFFSVERDVEAFTALTGQDVRYLPREARAAWGSEASAWRGHLLDDADRGGIHV